MLTPIVTKKDKNCTIDTTDFITFILRKLEFHMKLFWCELMKQAWIQTFDNKRESQQPDAERTSKTTTTAIPALQSRFVRD